MKNGVPSECPLSETKAVPIIKRMAQDTLVYEIIKSTDPQIKGRLVRSGGPHRCTMFGGVTLHLVSSAEFAITQSEADQTHLSSY